MLTMDVVTTIISIIVAVIVIGFIYYYFKRAAVTGNNYVIVDNTSDGKTQFDSKMLLPLSNNEDPGMAFSYACWVRINDFGYKYGAPKVVFTKGPTDLTSMCPALLLDANTNSFIVKMDTFGGTEVIPVNNIPAKKWIHVAIAVSQSAMDIYINGTLYLHHTLVNIPRQNRETVHTAVNGGFDGQIAGLQYFRTLLGPSEVSNLMQNTPQPSQQDINGPVPPYFDMSFWTGH